MKNDISDRVTNFVSRSFKRFLDIDLDVFSFLGAITLPMLVFYLGMKIHRADPLDAEIFTPLVLIFNFYYLMRSHIRFKPHQSNLSKCVRSAVDAFDMGQIQEQEVYRLIELGKQPHRSAKFKEVFRLFTQYIFTAYLVFLLALVVGYEAVIYDCDRYFRAPYKDIMGDIVKNPYDSVGACVYLNDFYPDAPRIWGK